MSWLERFILGEPKPAPTSYDPRADVQKLVAQVIELFDEIPESQLASTAARLMRIHPDRSEHGIMYALRVSKCVPKLVNPKILAGRWNTANCGAGGTGLQIAADSPNLGAAVKKLTAAYLAKLEELLDAIINKAEATAQSRKSDGAKANAYAKAYEKIEAVQREFDYAMDGFDELVKGKKDFLYQLEMAIA